MSYSTTFCLLSILQKDRLQIHHDQLQRMNKIVYLLVVVLIIKVLTFIDVFSL